MKKTIAASLLFVTFALRSFGGGTLVVQHPPIILNVLGSVKNPSRITLPEGATILDALAAVGSVSDTGDLHRVKVIHRSATEKPEMTVVNVRQILNGAVANVVLQDGDTINVPNVLFNIQ